MLDLGWSELLVIGVLTVLIFGPKELPVVLRTVTQWLGKARSVARDFQRTMEDVARESELDEIRKTVRQSTEEMKKVGDPAGSFEGLFDLKDAELRNAGKSAPKPSVEAPSGAASADRTAGTEGDRPAPAEAPEPPASDPAKGAA